MIQPEASETSAPGPSAVSSGCAPLGQRAAALSVVDRSLVGAPAAYAPDPSLRAREVELSSSLRARRVAAWQIAERVLREMPLRAELGVDTASASLPAWQTWHAKDDLTRIFRRAYPELSATRRVERAPLPGAALDAAWAWNDGAVRDFEDWTSERLLAYRTAVDEASEVAGLGGIYRVSYSPAASRHLLESYAEVLGCVEAEPVEAEPVQTEADIAAPLRTEGACAPDERARPACLTAEFPNAAVVVKASWRRADLGEPLPVFDTSKAALERRLSEGGTFSWAAPDGQATPDAGEIYTLRLPSGNAFQLAGLHIMSKELDQWFWITLWWSEDPDSDFGEDRPDTLPAPFDHYKLCSVVSFAEADADPAGEVRLDYPSLAAAREATALGPRGPSWCSNPYLEEGDGNAATNCIGCHQHAGTRLEPEAILGNPEAFPEFGRTEVRRTFPADYVFAPTSGDNLGAMFEETEDHFMTTER